MIKSFKIYPCILLSCWLLKVSSQLCEITKGFWLKASFKIAWIYTVVKEVFEEFVKVRRNCSGFCRPSSVSLFVLPPLFHTVCQILRIQLGKVVSVVSLAYNTIWRKGRIPQTVLMERFWGTSRCTSLPRLALDLSWLKMSKHQPVIWISVLAWLHAQNDKPFWDYGQLTERQSDEHVSVCIWPHQHVFKDSLITYENDSTLYIKYTGTQIPVYM